jgi:hypothetical protein
MIRGIHRIRIEKDIQNKTLFSDFSFLFKRSQYTNKEYK